MCRFELCVGKATDFGNVPRNVTKMYMNKLGVTATSDGRATPGSAIAPLLRNGYAALRIPNAEMRRN